MLPKSEKNKKLNNLLADPVSQAENEAVVYQKRLKTKRHLILVSLILTTGVSLIFWGYRIGQKIINSPSKINFDFKINLPKINLKFLPQKNNLSDFEIKEFFKNSKIDWSVLTAFSSNSSQSVFQYNYPVNNLDPIVTNLLKIKPSSQSLINLDLPQGLSFQEQIKTDDGIIYQNLISLPQDKIIIVINLKSIDNVESIKSDLSNLVNLLYWYSVSHLN